MWTLKTLEELSMRQLHQIYKARTEVFVVEQNCAYPEVDDLDLKALHLFLENSGAVLAYCRLIDCPNQVKLGRVLVVQAARKDGLGRSLVTKVLEICQENFPEKPIYAQAQTYLQDFYDFFGFKPISESYLEDGIPHIDMLLER